MFCQCIPAQCNVFQFHVSEELMNCCQYQFMIKYYYTISLLHYYQAVSVGFYEGSVFFTLNEL